MAAKKTNRDQLQELLILDAHILHGVQQSDPVREPPLHFQNAFPHGIASPLLSNIFRQEYSEVAESLDCRQEDWDDLWFTFVTRFTGLNASRSRSHGCLVSQYGRAFLAVHEDIDNV